MAVKYGIILNITRGGNMWRYGVREFPKERRYENTFQKLLIIILQNESQYEASH